MMSEPIEAIILAGGMGTRIASVLGDCPKVLAPIHGRPYLDYLLKYLAESGIVERVVIAAGDRAHDVVEHCKNIMPPLPVDFSVETSPLGTGGALLKALPLVAGRTILVLNGDSYVDLDLRETVTGHQRAVTDATLVAVHVEDSGPYGTIQLDGDGVTGFMEKSGKSTPAWINAGIYMFDRPALMRFPPRFPAGGCSLERDILPELVDGIVRVCKSDGPFIDIGTPESYARAESFFERF